MLSRVIVRSSYIFKCFHFRLDSAVVSAAFPISNRYLAVALQRFHAQGYGANLTMHIERKKSTGGVCLPTRRRTHGDQIIASEICS